MKKIMIYTKTGFHSPKHTDSLLEKVKTNALLIMLFTLFFCGTIIGAVFYSKNQASGYLFTSAFAKNLISEQLNRVILFSVFILGSVSLCCLFSGFCGLGFCTICFLPILLGMRYAITASYLLSSFAAKGLGYFCVIQLPGAVIAVTASLYLCELSCKMSKKVAAELFSGSREEIDLKTYGIHFCILCAFFVLAAITDCICVSLFAKLF